MENGPSPATVKTAGDVPFVGKYEVSSTPLSTCTTPDVAFATGRCAQEILAYPTWVVEETTEVSGNMGRKCHLGCVLQQQLWNGLNGWVIEFEHSATGPDWPYNTSMR